MAVTSKHTVFTRVALLPAIVWAVALFLPAYRSAVPPATGFNTYTGSDYSGFETFISGIGSFLQPFPYGTAWAANIVMFIAVERTIRADYRKAKILSVLAVLLSLTSLLIKDLLKNENGDTFPVTIGPAVYVWIASTVVLAVCVFVYARRATKQ